MGNEITSVKTRNVSYYVGMTREVAERTGSYKKKIGIDFKDLDTNNDGVLDEREVLVGAKKQAKRNMYRAGICTGLSAFGTAALIATTPFTLGETGVFAAPGCGVTVAGAIATISAYDELQEADAQLKKFDTKM